MSVLVTCQVTTTPGEEKIVCTNMAGDEVGIMGTSAGETGEAFLQRMTAEFVRSLVYATVGVGSPEQVQLLCGLIQWRDGPCPTSSETQDLMMSSRSHLRSLGWEP